MSTVKKKPVEYRDTFDFRIFPDFAYTAAQRLRFRLFQGRIEHWKAAVNYADRFSGAQNINLLYMIGYSPRLKAYVEQKTSTNLVVLCAPFTAEDLEVYDRFWRLVSMYKASGMADADGNFTPYFYETAHKNIQHRDLDEYMEQLAREYEEHLAVIEAYQQLKERSADYFNRFILVDKLHAERTVSFSSLDWITKSYFPYGRERIGMDDKAIRFIKRISEALQAGLNRENASKIMGLPAGADPYALCKQEIRRCEMDISVSLRKSGTADLAAIFKKMQSPPYGWDNDTHTAYCFGYAVSKFLDDAWIWDTITSFPAADTAQSVLRSIMRGDMGRRHTFVLTVEDGKRLSSRFAYLFDMGTATPRDAMDEHILELWKLGLSERKIAEQIQTVSNIAVHKRLMRMKAAADSNVPFCNMTHRICTRIEQMTRWPVAVIDSRLRQVICGTYDSEHYVSIPVFDKDGIREALEYFTVERCREIKAKLDRINSYIPELIRERYGDVDIDEIYRHGTTQCSGWLWTEDEFWETVDECVYKKNRVYWDWIEERRAQDGTAQVQSDSAACQGGEAAAQAQADGQA